MTSDASTTRAANADPLVGTILDGRYRVEHLLGEGGMGVVYKATHTALNKPLAVKVLRGDVSRDEEILARFRQEAQSASSIGNEHIIDISDFGALPDGSTYFVMEFLDGKSLTDAIEKERPFSAPRTIHIMQQLCRALGAAHEQGIVHRDLKPDNIYLVTRSLDPDFVKVLDFGIAKVGGGSSKLTRAGQVFGTPHYMSPEQCQGSEVDLRTDIYALGVIMYEMLTGSVPFDADNLMGILTKHIYAEPKPPSEASPGFAIDPMLDKIVLRALAKQPGDRYATMRMMREDLERLQVGAPLADTGVITGVSAAQTGGFGAIVGDAPKKRGKLPLVLAGVAVAAAIAGGTAFVLAPTPAPAPVRPGAVLPPIAPQPAAPTAPAVVERVHIESTPPGAEVLRDGAVIGQTPFDIEKPQGSAELRLELRAPDYEPKAINLIAATPLSLNISLDRVRPAVPEPPPPQQSRPRKQRTPPRESSGRSEIIDPFAD